MKKKEKRGFNDGYISFTPEDLRKEATNDTSNAEAYDWLDKAITTSSKVQKKSKNGKMIEIDDIYPVTADETEQMRNYLDNAQQSATNPNDSTFNSRLKELRAIVDWSSKRHWSFQWILIVGVIVTLICISMMSSDSDSMVAKAQKEKAKIEAWSAQDTTIVVEKMATISSYKMPDYSNANKYKYNKLSNVKFRMVGCEKSEKAHLASADTASTNKSKQDYILRAEESRKEYAKYSEEYETINNMKFKDISKLAIEDIDKTLDRRNKHARKLFLWSAFFMILIPLYIFAQRPYGYTITRLRLESKILSGLQKVLFGLAGGMAAGAAAMEFMPDTIVKWSDGSTTRESDSGSNAAILAMKLMFIAAAIAIFCGTSCFLMTYLTIQGLRRNYNWSPIIAKLKGATASAIEKAKEAKEKQTEE